MGGRGGEEAEGCESLFVISLVFLYIYIYLYIYILKKRENALGSSPISLASCPSLAYGIQKTIIGFVLALTSLTPNNSFDFTLFYTKYKALYSDRPLPSKEFLSWLIGFTEGDGSFIEGKGDFLSPFPPFSTSFYIYIYIFIYIYIIKTRI